MPYYDKWDDNAANLALATADIGWANYIQEMDRYNANEKEREKDYKRIEKFTKYL